MPVSGEELAAAVERALGRPPARMVRRPATRASSALLEEVDVWAGDDEPVRLLLKDVDGSLHDPPVRPSFLVDPAREIFVYEHVLAGAGFGTPRCYGTGRHWLLLERVEGVPLYERGEVQTWKAVARRLADLHQHVMPPHIDALPVYDDAFYRRWPERARSLSPGPEVDRAAAGYDAVIECLLSLPTGFAHGELYPSNVIVRAADDSICVVDWETACIAPGLLDVAALTSGGWSDADRDAIAYAYYEALDAAAQARYDSIGFARALACCRLQLALQWLGWSAGWAAPPEHANDWRAEAARAWEAIAA